MSPLSHEMRVESWHQPEIWIVEDEKPIADVLIYTLESDGFNTQWFERGLPALTALHQKMPSLIVLDIGLPDINGFELSREILKFSNVPFIFLTARGEELDRIVGLEIGADDYIVKPFSPREVSTRIRTILRRVNPIVIDDSDSKMSDDNKNIGDFRLNRTAKNIYFCDILLTLTRYEYLLLKTFLLAPNRVYSRPQLMDIVWQDEESMERTIDTHIKTLRAKLSEIDATQTPIKTHRGLGYSLDV